MHFLYLLPSADWLLRTTGAHPGFYGKNAGCTFCTSTFILSNKCVWMWTPIRTLITHNEEESCGCSSAWDKISSCVLNSAEWSHSNEIFTTESSRSWFLRSWWDCGRILHKRRNTLVERQISWWRNEALGWVEIFHWIVSLDSTKKI